VEDERELAGTLTLRSRRRRRRRHTSSDPPWLPPDPPESSKPLPDPLARVGEVTGSGWGTRERERD
jgi:hypothetical protein